MANKANGYKCRKCDGWKVVGWVEETKTFTCSKCGAVDKWLTKNATDVVAKGPKTKAKKAK